LKLEIVSNRRAIRATFEHAVRRFRKHPKFVVCRGAIRRTLRFSGIFSGGIAPAGGGQVNPPALEKPIKRRLRQTKTFFANTRIWGA